MATADQTQRLNNFRARHNISGQTAPLLIAGGLAMVVLIAAIVALPRSNTKANGTQASNVTAPGGGGSGAQSSVPGDGAAVGLVTLSDESPILDIECRTYGEYAGDMTLAIDPPRKWWQPGSGEGCIGFTETKIAKVLARGNRQVPEVALAVCDRIGLQSKDIDLLVTNQPNRVFLGNWREALEVPRERHRDTFDECGNLFGAGIPINLDRAISDGQVNAGDVVMMAAFAHAGDFAGAAAVRWGGRR